jgi:hypothetical protein
VDADAAPRSAPWLVKCDQCGVISVNVTDELAQIDVDRHAATHPESVAP